MNRLFISVAAAFLLIGGLAQASDPSSITAAIGLINSRLGANGSSRWDKKLPGVTDNGGSCSVFLESLGRTGYFSAAVEVDAVNDTPATVNIFPTGLMSIDRIENADSLLDVELTLQDCLEFNIAC